MKILNRYTGELILEIAGANLCDANLRGAYLCGADLCDANLRGANLRGADLRGADLYDANLRGAYLCGANLCDANLRGAYLCGADLRGADLCDAYLCGADLRGADLRGANLCGANLNWQSHDLISCILLQAAGQDVKKRKLAGLILVSRDWCWKEFQSMREPLAPWAKEVFSKFKDCP